MVLHKMALITLPDLCLLTICDHLPLPDLLRINLVCHRFNSLRSAAICRRRSLMLFKDQHDIQLEKHQYCYEEFSYVKKDKLPMFYSSTERFAVRMALRLENISQEACLNLSCYFVNLTELRIHNDSITPLMVQNVAHLIAAMKTLTTLKLFFTIENDQVGEDELTAT